VTPATYLAGVAASRALYCLLYEEAIGVLPPPVVGSQKLEAITCGQALGTLAKKLHLSRKTVSEDLRRLIGYRWVVIDSEERVQLGHRVGGVSVLHADIAAEEATGERGLVTNTVLHVRPVKEQAPAPVTGRGGARRFER
jgi:hypothetical protein